MILTYQKLRFLFKIAGYLLFPLLLSPPLQAQYQTVNYQYERNWFNENQPLPAEYFWMLNGDVPSGIEMVELTIYRSANFDKQPLFVTAWKKVQDKPAATYSMPVNYKLQGNAKYSFTINYFRAVGKGEKLRLANEIFTSLDAYINQQVIVNKNSVELRKHPKLILSDLDQLVKEASTLYRSKTYQDYEGFSNLVLDKIYQIDQLQLKKAKFSFIKSEDETDREMQIKFFKQQLEELKVIARYEVKQYLNTELFVLSDSRKVVDYPTQKTKNIIPINVGYAAVYFDGDLDDISYDAGPFVGLSFPLGKSALSSKFWSKSSISTGVFVNNMEFENGTEYTGPLISRPFYLGLGYKTFYLLRINAGATFLQEKDQATGTFSFNKVKVKPYIGLGLEINLWMGLEK